MGQLLGSEKTHLLDQELNKVLIYLQVKNAIDVGSVGTRRWTMKAQRVVSDVVFDAFY
jgi:hypothetical protein